MAKALQIVPQHEVREVWQAYRESRCPTEKRRVQALALLLEGRKRKEIEAVTQYSRSGISELITRYNQEGLAGLKDKRHENNGAPRKLTDTQRAEILIDINQGIELGYMWSGKRLIEHIFKKYGIQVPEGSVYRIFRELGFSLQTPRPSHDKGDPIAQEAFKTKS